MPTIDNDTYEKLLAAVCELPPMTEEARIEQKIDWVHGNLAISNSNTLSKDAIAAMVWKEAWRRQGVEVAKILIQATNTAENFAALIPYLKTDEGELPLKEVAAFRANIARLQTKLGMVR